MKQIIKYKCDFCERSYVSKYKAKEHESKCFYNPDVKSCITCKHKDVKKIIDDEGCVDDVMDWCFKMDREIFRKGSPVKDCIGWHEQDSYLESEVVEDV